MKIHKDGTLEGTPEELAAYKEEHQSPRYNRPPQFGQAVGQTSASKAKSPKKEAMDELRCHYKVMEFEPGDSPVRCTVSNGHIGTTIENKKFWIVEERE